ncbi:hypothetical protein SD78_4328 [Bacillus badius]|nr:hypothetical protein SD78_4328 [Bacillus badius]
MPSCLPLQSLFLLNFITIDIIIKFNNIMNEGKHDDRKRDNH